MPAREITADGRFKIHARLGEELDNPWPLRCFELSRGIFTSECANIHRHARWYIVNGLIAIVKRDQTKISLVSEIYINLYNFLIKKLTQIYIEKVLINWYFYINISISTD